jgi:hypothetical protein
MDGSDTEKTAMKAVLQKMNDYFIFEVYSREEYKEIIPLWYVPVTLYIYLSMPFFESSFNMKVISHLSTQSINKNEL